MSKPKPKTAQKATPHNTTPQGSKWLRVRNWDRHQSYRRDRGQPPWIKLHRALLRDEDWIELSDAERGQLSAMWLLAADRNGLITSRAATIKKLCQLDSEPDIKKFISLGFLEPADKQASG